MVAISIGQELRLLAIFVETTYLDVLVNNAIPKLIEFKKERDFLS